MTDRGVCSGPATNVQTSLSPCAHGQFPLAIGTARIVCESALTERVRVLSGRPRPPPTAMSTRCRIRGSASELICHISGVPEMIADLFIV